MSYIGADLLIFSFRELHSSSQLPSLASSTCSQKFAQPVNVDQAYYVLGIMPGAGDTVMNERNSFKGGIYGVRQQGRIEQMGTCATYRRQEG